MSSWYPHFGRLLSLDVESPVGGDSPLVLWRPGPAACLGGEHGFFPVAACRIFSLVLSSFTGLGGNVVFFPVVGPGLRSSSWICGFLSFIICGPSSAIVQTQSASCPHSLSSPGAVSSYIPLTFFSVFRFFSPYFFLKSVYFSNLPSRSLSSAVSNLLTSAWYFSDCIFRFQKLHFFSRTLMKIFISLLISGTRSSLLF